MDLNSARIFACVATKGSFSSAAKFMGIPVATVSRKVAELESSLNIRLLERSTRKLRLTEAGETLFAYVVRGVEEMDAGLLALTESESKLRGKLRFSMPPSFEPMWTLLEQFQNAYREIEVELTVSERRLEFIEDGIDVALRVGKLESQTAIARPLALYRHKVVAAPTFLAGQILSCPRDILRQRVAAWSKPHQPVTWVLGKEQLSITPYLRANDYFQMRYLALEGKCLTELPPFLCHPYLEGGELIEVLPQHPMPEQNVNLVFPSKKSISRISRVFIDYCVAHFDVGY